jgi:hydrogenase maturation protease
MTVQPKILLYGYGNPGRQDDALGIMAIEKIEKWCKRKNYSSVHTLENFQLNIEDAYNISQYETIIFIDAARDISEPFEFVPLTESKKVEFSMHSVSPGFVLSLCNQIYETNPNAFILKIKGEEWEFNEPLTANADNNLQSAINFLKQQLSQLITTQYEQVLHNHK